MIGTFVRADRLRLATLFQSTESARIYLNGVHIAADGNKGVRLTATDGHRLIMFHDEAGFTMANCIIAFPKAARAAVKASKTKDFLWFGILGEHDGTGRREARIIDATDGMRTMEEVQNAMEDPCDAAVLWSGAVDLIAGQFPDMEKVIPDTRAEAAPGGYFNGKYFADFVAVASDLSPKKSAVIRIFSDGNNAAYVDCGRADAMGILMPMRDSGISPLLKNGAMYRPPAWAKAAL